MNPEFVEGPKSTREFKHEAAKLITERGVKGAQASLTPGAPGADAPGRQRMHQARTSSRFRNFSAWGPCGIASVAVKPASTQLGAATVTERGAPVTGQPVRGFRMWEYRTPSLSRKCRASPLVARPPRGTVSADRCARQGAGG